MLRFEDTEIEFVGRKNPIILTVGPLSKTEHLKTIKTVVISLLMLALSLNTDNFGRSQILLED
jgi:hypothetical protein